MDKRRCMFQQACWWSRGSHRGKGLGPRFLLFLKKKASSSWIMWGTFKLNLRDSSSMSSRSLIKGAYYACLFTLTYVRSLTPFIILVTSCVWSKNQRWVLVAQSTRSHYKIPGLSPFINRYMSNSELSNRKGLTILVGAR